MDKWIDYPGVYADGALGGPSVMTQSYNANWLTFTPKGASMTDNAAYGNVIGVDFTNRTPDTSTVLNVVKLEKKNLDRIGGRLVRSHLPVQVLEDGVQYGTDTFNVGEWIVKEWDYEKGVEVFRVATLDERKRYDLK